MSIFEDKKYNEMDWLAQAVEPIVSSINDKLQTMPTEFVLNINDITRLAFSGYSDLRISIDTMFEHAVSKHLKISIRTLEKEIIESYKIVVVGEPILDMINNTLEGGTIKIVKTRDHFEEKDLLKLMGRDGVSKLNSLDTRRVDVTRANEIMELFGGMDALLKSKSIGSKCGGIAHELSVIMQENRWNIRNVDLSNRIGEWIYLYLQHGNLAALTNFCKFKVMTHEGAPIYSIQEESV